MCAKLQCPQSLRDKKACESTGLLEASWQSGRSSRPDKWIYVVDSGPSGYDMGTGHTFLDRELSWCLWIDLARL
jgi:hypothetical protein